MPLRRFPSLWPPSHWLCWSQRCSMQPLIMTLGLFVFVIGCHVHLHPYRDYLNQSVGHTRHDAIAEKMGAPNRVVPLVKGGEVWTYEYCEGGGGVTGTKGSVAQSS